MRNFWCLVNGTPEFHPNGYYYQRVKSDGKEKWESLGIDPHAAQWKATAQAKKEAHGTEDVLGLKSDKPEHPTAAEKPSGYRLCDASLIAVQSAAAYLCLRVMIARIESSVSSRR